jgi:hypothetical protein
VYVLGASAVLGQLSRSMSNPSSADVTTVASVGKQTRDECVMRDWGYGGNRYNVQPVSDLTSNV